MTEPKHINEDDEISIKELILNIESWVRYLFSKWLIFAIIGLLGGALGLCYALMKQPTYTAVTTFVLEGGEGGSGLSQYAGVAAMVGIDLGGNPSGLFQGDNILSLYKSRTMLAQALMSKVYPDSNELLIERYINYTGARDGWEGHPELNELDFHLDPSKLTKDRLRARDSVITVFANTIKESILRVDKLDKKVSIISVETTSPDEIFSKAFNENLVSRVNDFYVQTKTRKSADNIAILQYKVDSVRLVMEKAIYSAATVSDATPNLNPTRQAQRVVPSQEAQFSAETNKAMLSQLLQNLELAKMSLMQEQPLIQVVDRPVYPLKVNRLGKVKGILLGGVLFGALTIFYLFFVKWYRDMMNDRK